MFEIFYLVIFILSTVVHLYASAKKNKKLRNVTKPFILISLLGYYAASTVDVRLTVVLALIFSWIGDLLLIPNGVKWFTMGGISFMISHAFFALSYYPAIDFSCINPVVIAVLAVIYITAVVIIFKKLRPHLPKPLFYPMFLYLLINGTMNCFAIFRMLTATYLPTILTCIGAVLFFISDTTLFFVRFNKESKIKTHFWVMLTYSIGEFLIVCGLI